MFMIIIVPALKKLGIALIITSIQDEFLRKINAAVLIFINRKCKKWELFWQVQAWYTSHWTGWRGNAENSLGAK